LRWTKARLARAAGLDQSLVGKIEAGRVVPYPCELERLAAALGIVGADAGRLLQDLEDLPCR
jgi:transcriptional regulator with XRE-family HTH domain